MKQTNRLTFLWFSGGIICTILLFVVLCSGFSGRIYISDPEKIQDTVDAVMNCIQSGDWTDLENLVVGKPALVPYTGQEASYYFVALCRENGQPYVQVGCEYDPGM